LGLPQITRGIGARDDLLVTTTWSLSTSAAATATLTTDGDIGTVTVVFTNATNASGGIFQSGLSLLTNTYPSILVRHRFGGLTGLTPQLAVTYSDASTSVFTMTTSSPSTAYVVETFALTANKTVNTVTFQWLSGTSISGTIVGYFDFYLIFKETLTLPTAIQPIGFRKQRNIVEIPIIQREGGQVQDLGSLTPDVGIAGGLVNTTSGQSGWTNTYTADQWWQILYGLTLETGTLQADGNPTWQWLVTDQIQGKYFPKAFFPQQVPGRVAYHNYALSLKQFNVVGESTANLVGVTY
jgi:hypothetical protein